MPVLLDWEELAAKLDAHRMKASASFRPMACLMCFMSDTPGTYTKRENWAICSWSALIRMPVQVA